MRQAGSITRAREPTCPCGHERAGDQVAQGDELRKDPAGDPRVRLSEIVAKLGEDRDALSHTLARSKHVRERKRSVDAALGIMSAPESCRKVLDRPGVTGLRLRAAELDQQPCTSLGVERLLECAAEIACCDLWRTLGESGPSRRQ